MTLTLIQKQIVPVNGLNVRSRPDTKSTIVAGLAAGATVRAVDGLNAAGSGYNWQAIVLDDSTIGWSATTIAGVATMRDLPVPVPVTTAKVGAHLMGSLAETDIVHALNLKANVYKVVDNVGLAQRIHAALPNAAIIFRRYRPDGYWLNLAKQNVASAVDAWFADRASDLAAMPWAYHESDNEIGADDAYLAFEAARARRLAIAGQRACLLNIQTGSTDSTMWKRATDMLKACEEGGHLIGVHGYAQSVMSANYGNSYADAAGTWHGDVFPDIQSQEAWTALRVKRDIRDVEALGFYRAQFVVTETGLDDLASPGNGIYYLLGQKSKGWKTCEAVWRTMGWLNGITAAQFYRKQLAWLDSQYQIEPRIRGGVVFTHGSDDAQWDGFDTRPVFL